MTVSGFTITKAFNTTAARVRIPELRREEFKEAAEGALRADREAAPGCLASFVRLDGDRPDAFKKRSLRDR